MESATLEHVGLDTSESVEFTPIVLNTKSWLLHRAFMDGSDTTRDVPSNLYDPFAPVIVIWAIEFKSLSTFPKRITNSPGIPEFVIFPGKIPP